MPMTTSPNMNIKMKRIVVLFNIVTLNLSFF